MQKLFFVFIAAFILNKPFAMGDFDCQNVFGESIYIATPNTTFLPKGSNCHFSITWPVTGNGISMNSDKRLCKIDWERDTIKAQIVYEDPTVGGKEARDITLYMFRYPQNGENILLKIVDFKVGNEPVVHSTSEYSCIEKGSLE